MKSNQISIKVSSRRGVMPFGSINTKVDKKHLYKILEYVLKLMDEDVKSAQTTTREGKDSV